MNASKPLRAADGAVAWSAQGGWLYSSEAASDAVASGDMVLVVTAVDGMIHGVQPHDRAPLAAILRVEAEAVDVRRWHAKLAAKLADLQARVSALEDRASGHDTGDAIELLALKKRVRKLEEGG